MTTLRLFLLFALLGLGPTGAVAAQDDLLEQARNEAPGELQLHVVKTKGRLSDFIAKVRQVEKVSGWRQIRVTGDAAYASWDNLRKDFVWDGGKFEVLFDIEDNTRLELHSVTFAGRKSQPSE
ncbi:MAG: hypothetical protein H7A44_06230 [Opitutaceae bacterium]|nr:hypothetical protein [Cephaloticoccus sp.]MCP5530020.1 hypothetical protein [Opitutaceae bacterium]